MDSDWPPAPFPYQRASRARRFWWWIERHNGLLTAIATIILAAVTLSLAFDSHGQLGTIQKLAQEMEASRRPWIPAKVTVSQPLTYDGLIIGSVPDAHEPSVGLVFHLRNVGNSPAFNVGVLPILYRPGHQEGTETTREVLAYQDEWCDPIRKATNPKMTDGYTLFPGDEVPDEMGVSVTMGREEAAVWRDNTSPINLYLVGCIYYTDDRHDSIHTTPFSYRIFTYSVNGQQVPIGGPKPRKSVDASHVSLMQDVTRNPD